MLGGKAAVDMIRSGKSEARAAAVFEIDDPGLKSQIENTLGGQLDDGELIITRRITVQGRSSAQVNGLPVTVSTLQKLGDCLVDIHGQLEGPALLDPARQRELLDAYGGLGPKLAAYTAARQAHETLRLRAQALVESVESRERERASWNSSATSFPPQTRRRANTRIWRGRPVCSGTPVRSDRPPRPGTACSTKPTPLRRTSCHAWHARSSRFRKPRPSWNRRFRPSSGSPTKHVKSPTACAGSPKAGETTRPASNPSRAEWPSTGGWRPGSIAPLTSWPLGFPQPS